MLLHCVLIALPLAMLYHHGKSRGRDTPLSWLSTRMTAPSQALMSSIVHGVRDFLEEYLLLHGVAQRAAETERENEALKMTLTLVKRRLDTAEHRTKICGFRYAREDLLLVPARVVAQDLGPLNRVLRLAIELPDDIPNIPQDASVIMPTGLVGRIDRTVGSYAEVELITDPRSRLHARAGDRGVLGTVHGVGAQDRYGLRFRTTEVQARLSEGDPVVTSGHDRRFEDGLVVGVIASDEARQAGVHLEYIVKPAVAFWELRDVLVVVGKEAVE